VHSEGHKVITCNAMSYNFTMTFQAMYQKVNPITGLDRP